MVVFYKTQFKKSLFSYVKYYSIHIIWMHFRIVKIAFKCEELWIMGITDMNLTVEFVLYYLNFIKSFEHFDLFNINDLDSIIHMNNLQFY